MSPAERAPLRPTSGSADSEADPYPVVRSDEYLTLFPSGGAAPARRPTPGSAAPVAAGPRRATAYRPPPAGATWPDDLWNEAPRPAPAEDPIVDFGQLRELLGFPLRALRRRRRTAAWVFAAVLAATAAALTVAPRQYDVETSILAQRNFVMPALGNPRRSVPAESDSPTRMAAEAVLNRENLLSLVQEVGLEAAWPRLRTPAGRLKDAVREVVSAPLPADERRERLVNYLRGQMWVYADEGTVRIGVHFPDPRLALRLVQAAQRNFLEKRHASEQALIRESIDILETHAGEAHDRIDSALKDVRTYAPRARAPLTAAYAAPAGLAAAPRRASGADALEGELGARRAALAAAESTHAQRTVTLQGRLAELRKTLGAAHPEVVAAQASLDAVRGDSTELVGLRAAARDAEARVVAAGGSAARRRAPGAGMPSDAALASAALVRIASQATDTIEDPRLTYARSRLKIAVADYEDLLDRLEGARIELETARAAFKYRYSVITPPQLPTRRSKPNVPVMLVAGVIVGAMLATFAAATIDLGSGRLVEGWQVARLVGVPVLGDVPRG